MGVKTKVALDKVKQARKISFKILFIAMEKSRLKSELNSTKTKGRKIFKHLGKKKNTGHLYSLISFAPTPHQKKYTKFFVSVIGDSFVT